MCITVNDMRWKSRYGRTSVYLVSFIHLATLISKNSSYETVWNIDSYQGFFNCIATICKKETQQDDVPAENCEKDNSNLVAR